MRPFIELGKPIKKARETKGLTQVNLAERYGYSTAQFVSNWERGVSFPPTKIFRDLCKLLGLDLEYMVKKLRLLRIKQIDKEINAIYKGKLL